MAVPLVAPVSTAWPASKAAGAFIDIHPFIILVIPYHAPIMAKLLFQKKNYAPGQLFSFFFFRHHLDTVLGPIRVSECPLAPGDISEGCVAVAQNREYRI